MKIGDELSIVPVGKYVGTKLKAGDGIIINILKGGVRHPKELIEKYYGKTKHDATKAKVDRIVIARNGGFLIMPVDEQSLACIFTKL